MVWFLSVSCHVSSATDMTLKYIDKYDPLIDIIYTVIHIKYTSCICIEHNFM